MMHEYMTLPDNTAIAHSDTRADGTVRVYIEKPVCGGFHHAECILPDYTWQNIEGFSDTEMEKLRRFVENNAHMIMGFASCGGFENAAGF